MEVRPDRDKALVDFELGIRAKIEASHGEPGDLADSIRALKSLQNEGVLTEEEFVRAKGRYLGYAPDERDAMLGTLTKLNDLRKAGVLTAIEFDIKKRDFLAATR